MLITAFLGFKSKETTILSVSVENGIVPWYREDGNRTISPTAGLWIISGKLEFDIFGPATLNLIAPSFLSNDGTTFK